MHLKDHILFDNEKRNNISMSLKIRYWYTVKKKLSLPAAYFDPREGKIANSVNFLTRNISVAILIDATNELIVNIKIKKTYIFLINQ